MYRAQLLLEPWQHQALKALAERRGQSISQVVREILRRHLGPARGRPRRGLASLAGIASDRGTRGRHHDQYLYGDARR
jgi:plasmid stability protein